MIVWTDRYEAFGRRISAAGTPTGGDLRFSQMGPATDPAWPTRNPDVAFGSPSSQFLVVWQSGPGREAYPAGEVV